MTRTSNSHMKLAKNTGHTSIIERFEYIASRHGERVALSYEKKEISYKDLKDRADGIAAGLTSYGIIPGTIIGICMEKSPDLIASMIAILKVGCTYFPVDFDLPEKRLDFILNNANPGIVLCSEAKITVISRFSFPVATPDQVYSNANASVPVERSNGNAAAYLLYTSGSTGEPKGVLIPHQGILRLTVNANWIQLQATDRILFHSPYTFDASTFEIWMPLLNGMALIIYPKKMVNFPALKNFLQEEKITCLWLTAAVFHIMAHNQPEFALPLRYLVSGGDILQSKAIRMVLASCPSLTVINGYGPTENTVFSSTYSMCATDPIPDNVPIGTPIYQTYFYVLNTQFQPVAEGETGELFVSGNGLAIGYLNRPDLNSKSFFFTEKGERIYKTGDLARRGKDGLFYFSGRLDDQVKISGYRIEIKEIESAIKRLDEIDECAVFAIPDSRNDKILVSFIKANQEISLNVVREKLKDVLPKYMMPSKILRLDQFPLTSNGKLDRAAILNRYTASTLAGQTELNEHLAVSHA